jgi:hypothetical protein
MNMKKKRSTVATTSKKSLSDEERRALLEEMARLEPDADLSPESVFRIFLPLPEHRRVLEDRVVLVLGERGVGKSALFHFLQTPDGARLLGREAETSSTRRKWIVGFSETTMEHASPIALESLAKNRSAGNDVLRRFWLGHLIGRLSLDVGEDTPSLPAFVARWQERPADPQHWLPAIDDPARLVLWLDELEQNLAVQDRWLVVTYDHLDKIGVRSRDIRRQVVPPLLALWLSLSNRYRRVRPKIFLRKDLFDESVANTSDVSKLLARAETLRWSVSSLYRLLVRHLAAHERLRDWLSTGKWKIPLTPDPVLGYMPPADFPVEGKVSQETLMSHIVGPRMGKGTDPRSGYSWLWVPKHLEDAQKIIAPRSMITLFKSAADNALGRSPMGQYMRLLAPEELKEGLRETSHRRVLEVTEEHPAVGRLDSLKELSLPAPVSDVIQMLCRPTDEGDDGFGQAGDRVLEELTRLGAVHRLPKDRIDVPDIYRLWFKIDRKGQKITPRR